jgi:hypothetical protein
MPGSQAVVHSSWFDWLCRAIVAFTLSGCALMLGLDRYREARTQQALDEIQSVGGFYARRDDTPRRPVIGIDLDATTVFDSGAIRRRGHVTDQTLRLVGRFTELKELSLDGADVTDAGLVSLRGLRALKRLNLAHTPLSDAGVIHLKELNDLRTVDVRGTKVTPAGASELRRALPWAEVLADPAE